ncbi:MFS transporter [Nocardia aurantiaca]|uniref:MFS transporter n=1 Tax=Nocardia aurantiaca TaxID=2675850 RepID=A0A6I3L4P3_9NOCA|nr:MFS transporter [Nocardia aurantiaca]
MTTVSTAVETRALRKVTRRFLPLAALCTYVLYIDRLNVSVAALTMNKQLGISPAAFGLVAGIFFWSYALCEIPSNFALSRVGVRVWVSRIIVSWGVVTMATAAVQGLHSLLMLRLLLGVAEAGFSPAMLFFLAGWFPRRNRALATALLTVAVPFSGITTPILTHIMTGLDGTLGLPGWRWLFLLTGLPAVVLGVVFYTVARNGPDDAAFLAPDERRWLNQQLSPDSEGTSREAFWRGVFNAYVVMLVIVYMLFACSLWGYQFFIPQILEQLGLGTNTLGWVVGLPPLLALGPMLWWARHADRKKELTRHYVVAISVAAIGFLFAGLAIDRPVLAITGFCVAGIGLYSCLATLLSIPSTFLSGAALAGGLATMNGLGNFGSYFGPQITGILRGITGDFTLAVLFLGLAALASAALALLLDTRLRRRASPASTHHTAPDHL